MKKLIIHQINKRKYKIKNKINKIKLSNYNKKRKKKKKKKINLKKLTNKTKNFKKM
jgi:hypothetical protein